LTLNFVLDAALALPYAQQTASTQLTMESMKSLQKNVLTAVPA
jgi:hypothetical protein